MRIFILPFVSNKQEKWFPVSSDLFFSCLPTLLTLGFACLLKNVCVNNFYQEWTKKVTVV